MWGYPSGSNPNTKRLMQHGATLRVLSVESGDAGVYTCTTSGVGTFTATLSIAGELMCCCLCVQLLLPCCTVIVVVAL